MPRANAAAVVFLSLVACTTEPIAFEGEYGRAVELVSGDASALPRLVFIDEGCEGVGGGCSATGDGACEPILIDSLAPFTTLKHQDASATDLTFGRECLELRRAAGLAAEDPLPEDLERAVTRMRFPDTPLLRAPAGGRDDWSWTAGNQESQIEPSGVLGGNVMQSFAVEFRTRREGAARMTMYREFPGSERDLADQGLAFLPLQFPGRLLGRNLPDRCDVDGAPCELGLLDSQSNRDVALTATRMVIDTCVGVPPCGIRYETNDDDPFAAGSCAETRGPDSEEACAPLTDPTLGGKEASLVVATGVPGLVLFEDSARRMFGALEDLPSCGDTETDTAACLRGQDGALHISGWPSAPADENETPLYRLGVRAVAVLPGLTRTRGEGPCSRAQTRLDAIQAQCDAFVAAFDQTLNIEDTTPPYASVPDSTTSLAVIGEARYAPGQVAPNSTRWLDTLILPETHPLALSIRRDVAPEAIEPDGLLGTALLDDTVTVLDYTDPNPGLRVRCLDPRSGDCLVAPDCSADAQPACCFGLPLNLLVEFIVFGDDDSCCGALSRDELQEIQGVGLCRGVNPP